MRVLLDENLPHDIGSELIGHDVLTVQGLGWAGIKNGELLQRAGGKVDAFLTMDRKIERQQKLDSLSFGVVVIRARSNRVDDLLKALQARAALVEKMDAAKAAGQLTQGQYDQLLLLTRKHALSPAPSSE